MKEGKIPWATSNCSYAQMLTGAGNYKNIEIISHSLGSYRYKCTKITKRLSRHVYIVHIRTPPETIP